jgi:hypothetical protein
MDPTVFMHLRSLWQPPLFSRHSSTSEHLVCSVLIINPALQLAHTRLLVEPFGHLLAQSAFLGHCLGSGFVFESQLDVLHLTAPGFSNFVPHLVG